MYGPWSFFKIQIKTKHMFTFFKERFMCSFMLFLAVKKIPIYAATISISGTTKNAKVLKMDTSFQSVNLFSSALKMASIQDNIIPANIVAVGEKKLGEGHWNKEIQSYQYRRIHRDVIVYIFAHLAYELTHRRCSRINQLGARIKRAG